MHLRFNPVACALALIPIVAGAQPLPARIDPPQPFPAIQIEAPTVETIAPGVEYAHYQLVTDRGPLSVHVVAIEPGHPDTHVGSVLADDALQSPGEDVSAMAARTDAVAGINGDYFDIGNTNRPTNIVVRDGRLLRTPRKRYALLIATDGTPTIAETSFVGQLQLADRTVTLDAINEMPPPGGGISLLTPEFGNVAPENNLTLVGLTVLDGLPPFARYRVTGVLDNLHSQPSGYYAAIGINAYGNAGVPNPGDVIAASGDLTPLALDGLSAAIGGGPLILQDGAWFDDPDGPSGGEYAMRIPCSGAAIAPDGTLFLIEVDGRQPSESVGLTRPEFAALMRGLGATRGMAFDGGGSSELVARRLGDAGVSLQSSPSDGVERPVADGVFVYNTAPVGDPVQIVARPGVVRMLVGASLPLHVAAVDDAEHVVPLPDALTASIEPAKVAHYRDGVLRALTPGTGLLQVRSGALVTDVALEIDGEPARATISPALPNLDENAHLRFTLRAYDAKGFALTIPEHLAWTASAGRIASDGAYVAGAGPATVSVSIAGVRIETRVTVGSHSLPLPFADRANFSTVPRGGAGSLIRDPACPQCLQLTFALGPSERAAYALADLDLPPACVGLAFDVRDDGSGALLRVGLRNAINEQVLLTATTLDDPGWRHVIVHFPATLVQPARLIAIYAIGATPAAPLGGSIVIRDVSALIAGAAGR